jgi:hypothetical protein
MKDLADLLRAKWKETDDLLNGVTATPGSIGNKVAYFHGRLNVINELLDWIDEQNQNAKGRDSNESRP